MLTKVGTERLYVPEIVGQAYLQSTRQPEAERCFARHD